MSAATCTTHPEATAHYRCDGCRRLLCEECVEQGHRLVFCRHCRERGLPLDPSVPDERARHQRGARDRPYSLADALLYPFRGAGSLMFWSWLAVLLVLALPTAIPVLGVLASCLGTVWALAVLVILPGTLMAIVRTTGHGGEELPDWPDFTEYSLRFAECLAFLLAGLTALLPGVLVTQLFGCSPAEWALGTASGGCWLLLVVHVALTTVLWIPAFGAVGFFGESFLAVRLDLHWRAIRAIGNDFWQVAAILIVLLVGGQGTAFFLNSIPLLGRFLSAFAGLYTWFTGAHLVGLLFRRHHDAVEAIYWPPR